MNQVSKRLWVAGLALAASLGLLSSAAHADLIYSGQGDNLGKDLNNLDTGSGGESPDFYDYNGKGGEEDSGARFGASFGGGSTGSGGSGGGGGSGGFFSANSFSSGDPNTGDTPPDPGPVGYTPPTDGLPKGPDIAPFTLPTNEDTPIPEPATLALLGAGLMGLGIVRRRRRK